jgi:hypothetical protein
MTSGPSAWEDAEIVFTATGTPTLCPIAVSVAGEVVTASLHTGRGSTHANDPDGCRLPLRRAWSLARRLPRERALNFGKRGQIACR